MQQHHSGTDIKGHQDPVVDCALQRTFQITFDGFSPTVNQATEPQSGEDGRGPSQHDSTQVPGARGQSWGKDE